MDPGKRMTSEQALADPYFITEEPPPSPELVPPFLLFWSKKCADPE